MIWQMENWSNKTPGGVSNGDVFIYCNFSQKKPNTKIFNGLNNLQFINCNLVNCDIPSDSEIEKCNTAINEYTTEGAFSRNIGRLERVKLNKDKKDKVINDLKDLVKENKINVFIKERFKKELSNG